METRTFRVRKQDEDLKMNSNQQTKNFVQQGQNISTSIAVQIPESTSKFQKWSLPNFFSITYLLVGILVAQAIAIAYLKLSIQNQSIIIIEQNSTLLSNHQEIIQLREKNSIQMFCKEQNQTVQTWNHMKNQMDNSPAYSPSKIKESSLGLLDFNDLEHVKYYLAQNVSKLQFYSNLFLNWHNPNTTMDKIDYYRLNLTYNMDMSVAEKRICIMSPFKNLLKYGRENASFHLFLKSINEQNYSNYHVYMIDDASTDGSSNSIREELEKYPRLRNRITIIKNQISFGALANRDFTTRKYCRPGDIVMDIDGDDALIGKQVFNLFNRFYALNQNAWFVYSNFIQVQGKEQGDGRNIKVDMSSAQLGPSKKIQPQIHQSNTYRTNVHWWCTSQLRTYLFDLYIKIPRLYFMDKQKGQYYQKASDRFVMYAVTELAGPRHTYYIDEYPYFYFQPNYQALKTYECSFAIIQFYEAKARIQTPFLPLQSLADEAELTKNYIPPIQIRKYRLQKQMDLIECKDMLLRQKERRLIKK